MRIQILALASVTLPTLQAAVVFQARSQTIEAWTPDNTIRFDFDDNGVEDWWIETFYNGNGTPVVLIRAAEETRFLFEYSVEAMTVVDFQPLPAAAIIGPNSNTLTTRFNSDPIAGVQALAVGFPLPDPRDGDYNFIGETAYLGFRFQGEESLHYGYALFTDTTSRGTTLVATAWESEPNTAIVAGAVPEPSTTLLVSLAGGSLLFWRRRAN